jgi:hypothetical protein
LHLKSHARDNSSATVRFGRRRHELAHRVDQLADRVVVRVDSLLQFGQLPRKFLVRGHELAEFDKGAHDTHADFDGTRAVEHIGRDDGAVLGEGVGEVFAVGAATGLQGRILRP